MSLSLRQLSVVWPIFFLSLFCTLRALPNCSGMDGLSGASRGNRNIPIHHRGALDTHKETQMEIYTEREHIQSDMHPVCM